MISIYSKYEVTKYVKSTYKSYDSDADDYFKTDKFRDFTEMDGGSLTNFISKKLNDSYFQDVSIYVINPTRIRLDITHFNPSDGEGDNIIYIIQELEDNKNEKE